MSGDANFTMKHTGLTIGGFTQPVVARNLIEIQANVEKGLCQRFLWIAPQPATVSFNELQRVDEEFSTALGKQFLFNMYMLVHIRKQLLCICHHLHILYWYDIILYHRVQGYWQIMGKPGICHV